MNDRLTQKDVAKISLIAAAIGAAGVAGTEGAKWVKKKLDTKRMIKWWKFKAEPVLMYAGFETSRRLFNWFDSRVVTTDELKPGMSPEKRALAVNRVRRVQEEFLQ